MRPKIAASSKPALLRQISASPNHCARRVDADGLVCWTLGTGDVPALARAAVHLLPIYDEYLNAYRDRRAEHHGPSLVPAKNGGYGTFQHALLIGGQVAGTWRVAPGQTDVRIITPPSRRLHPVEERNLRTAIARYRQLQCTSS